MNKVIEKIIALILIIILTSANLVLLGEYTLAYALTDEELNRQDSSTNHKNVEFNSYFYGKTHTGTFDVQKQDARLYLNIKVNNAGYIKDATVKIDNANFKLKDGIKNENIQSIDINNNKIILNRVNNGSDINLELPIELLKNDNISLDYFNKESITKFTATYVDASGKEHNINKEVVNKLSWKDNAELELNVIPNKYVTYAQNGNYGVMLQTKIDSKVKDDNLPIKNTNLEIQVPNINNTKPSSVNVIATKTEATNGKANGVDFTQENYSYDYESGKVTINISNNKDNITWAKNGIDEYLVTYLFEGQEIYNYAKQNQLNCELTVNQNITVYNNEETLITKKETVPVQFKQEEGTLTDFDINVPDSISKGYIYANYDTNNKVETEYFTKYIATVNSAKLTEFLEITQEYDKFLTDDGREGSTNVGTDNYAYNKKIEISKSEFNKILGEEGTITVKDEKGNVLGTINKDTTLENDVYYLDISSKNNSKLIIVTSKPITEGQLIFTVEKALKGNIAYSKEQMKAFEKMKMAFSAKTNTTTYNAWSETLLKEPETKVEMSVNKQDLTTVVPNNDVEIRATLDTSSEYNGLFENPVLKFTLPSAIEEVNLKSANILFDNGLKIKNANVSEENGKKVINVSIEGNQTQYAIGAEYKGPTIVLNTDLTLEQLTARGTEKVVLEYTNNKEESTKTNGILEQEVNYVAPTGVVTSIGIKNYKENAQEVTSISDETKTVEIDTYASKKTATISGNLINNYSNDISQITVLGILPVKGNKKIDTDTDLGSTFTTILSSGITVNGIDASMYTVYYSDNINPTKDLNNPSNGWNKELKASSKSYLIVFNDSFKLNTGKNIEFSYNIDIPEQLDPNNKAYGMYKVYYKNEADIGTIDESKETAVLGLLTEEGPILTGKITSSIDTVREGQIVKMYATVKNEGDTDANNVRIEIPVPEYSHFVDFIVNSQFETSSDKVRTIEIGDLKAKEEKMVSYYIRIDNITLKIFDEDMTKEEIEEANKFPKKVVHSLKIITDDLKNPISVDNYEMQMDDGNISIELISNIEDAKVLKQGDKLNFTIRVLNILGEGNLNNTVVSVVLPEGMKYISAEIDNKGNEGISFDEKNNILKIELGELEFYQDILLKTEVTDFEGNIKMLVTANADGVDNHYSNIFEHALEKVNLEVSELTGTPKYVKEKGSITYKVSITNKGNSKATNIKITDELPDGLHITKATYTYKEEVIQTSVKDNGKKLDISFNWLEPGETSDIEIVAEADYLKDKNDKEVKNKIIVQADSIETFESNEVLNIIEYNEEEHQNPEEPGTSENRYKITGTAWIDENKDGKRDSQEKLLSGVQVYLLDKTTNRLAIDPDNNAEKITTTNENGKYEFNNLKNGEYLVIFVYDSSKYSLTQYQAKDVDTSLNSDAIDINTTINGENRIAAITDTITINNQNARDIDIGIYEAEKFDLRLDKYISKITLTTPTIGTRVDNYNNEKLGKVEVLGQNLGKSTAVVEFNIVVKNEGSVSGYVKKIVDYLPKEFSFNTELNKDWYLSNNGNIYNSSLENVKINPGEEKEVKLVVAVNITESNLGILSNTAEIYETYNEKGLKDIDSVEANKADNEDDISKAEVILGIVTGKIIGYVVIAFIVIAIIGTGIFVIKKKVLDKK